MEDTARAVLLSFTGALWGSTGGTVIRDQNDAND